MPGFGRAVCRLQNKLATYPICELLIVQHFLFKGITMGKVIEFRRKNTIEKDGVSVPQDRFQDARNDPILSWAVLILEGMNIAMQRVTQSPGEDFLEEGIAYELSYLDDEWSTLLSVWGPSSAETEEERFLQIYRTPTDKAKTLSLPLKASRAYGLVMEFMSSWLAVNDKMTAPELSGHVVLSSYVVAALGGTADVMTSYHVATDSPIVSVNLKDSQNEWDYRVIIRMNALLIPQPT